MRDFTNPDRVVVGSFAEADGDAVAALYAPHEAPVVRTDIASAEIIKLASNAFLATRISFINEIANVCEVTGADVVDVARGMGLDHRLGPYFLRAGLGYGGSCFPKDVSALKQLAGNSGYHFQLLNAVIEVNELQKRRVIGKLAKHLGPLRGKTVALLGLAFKPNTNDMREASSLVLAARLLAEGATVVGTDVQDAAGTPAEGADRYRFVAADVRAGGTVEAVVGLGRDLGVPVGGPAAVPAGQQPVEHRGGRRVADDVRQVLAADEEDEVEAQVGRHRLGACADRPRPHRGVRRPADAGGIPLTRDSEVVGAIGVSGGAVDEDHEVACHLAAQGWT